MSFRAYACECVATRGENWKKKTINDIKRAKNLGLHTANRGYPFEREANDIGTNFHIKHIRY